MASEVVVEYIGRRAHVPPQQIAAVAPVGMEVVDALTEPGSEARARELLLAGKPYRLEIQSSQDSPVVDIYAQAPTPAQAERLADAAISGARDYLRHVAASTTLDPAKTGVDPAQSDPDRPAGRASRDGAEPAREHRGGGTDVPRRLRPRVRRSVLVSPRAAAPSGPRGATSPTRRSAGSVAAPPRRATVTAAVARASGALSWPVPVIEPGGVVSLRPAYRALTAPRTAVGDGDWPRTNRVLPWMLAGFMAVLWLVPFDSIKLDVPSPIDLQLDRLVLPVVVGTWALALLLGGRGAPRLRLSWIHAAVGGFVVVAFLSVIADAGSLNRSLEFDTALKKLPLLLSYPAMFLMFASVVRREEVAAFLKLMLALAVLCALGMVWEDQSSHNLFFELSDKLLPGVFHVGAGDAGWDTMGRRFVHGPTAHPLVAAGMLSMAFPIAVLGMIHERETRRRILYALAGVVLVVGVLSTQRKTGLIAPVTASSRWRASGAASSSGWRRLPWCSSSGCWCSPRAPSRPSSTSSSRTTSAAPTR